MQTTQNLLPGDRVTVTKTGESGKVVHPYTDAIGTRMAYVRLDGHDRKYLYQVASLQRS